MTESPWRRRFGTVRWRRSSALALLLVWSTLMSPALQSAGQDAGRPDGWHPRTHGRDVEPDYGRLFAMTRVHEIRITIPADRFQAMQEDLRTIGPGFPQGLFGRGGAAAGGGFNVDGRVAALVGEITNACTQKTAGDACSIAGLEGRCTALAGPLLCLPGNVVDLLNGGGIAGRGGAGGGIAGFAARGPLSMTSRDPIYVPVTVEHDGGVWTRVAMRYKGNSSLVMASAGGEGKIPFRLHFDRYEDEHPEIRNQRFYGFRELTFASNFGDDSQIHEAFATEIFRDRGVPAPRAAFYRVMVDVGQGFEYWGLYTMIEDPDDGAMLDAQFGGRGGNLYKPDGPGADWTRFVAEGFEKKTNAGDADWSDVERAIAALHAPQTDGAAWRAGLDAVFDADLFLRWLAVNTVIQNWDAYGVFPHNYYLYGDPGQDGRLRWIPWDHNLAFGAGPGGFGGGVVRAFPPGGPGGGAGPVAPGGAGNAGDAPAVPLPRLPFGLGGGDVLHRDVGSQWPLIQRLLADPVYAARYRTHLEASLEGLLAEGAADRRMRDLHALIAPWIVGERGERPSHTTISSAGAFEQSIDGPGGLSGFLRGRRETVRAALNP